MNELKVYDSTDYKPWNPRPKNTVIAHSTLHPAYHPGHQKLCQAEGEYAEELSSPAAEAQSLQNFKNSNTTTFGSDNIVQFQFIKEHNGYSHKAKEV